MNQALECMLISSLVKDSANSHGFVDVRVIEQKWKDMFTYFYRYVQLNRNLVE